MSETVTIDDGAEDADPGPIAEVVEGDAHVSPEDALAQAAKIVGDKDRQIAEAQQQARAAAETARRAQSEAARANAGRHQDHAAAIAAAVEAAKSEAQRARAAIKIAREAGDTDAEMDAQEAFNAASYRFNQATGELAQIKATPPGDGASAANGGVAAEAQAWIDRNPRFNSDRAFKEAMLKEHASLVVDGVTANSPAYFRALDAAAQAFGGNGGQNVDQATRRAPPASSSGAPSRGGGGTPSGSSRVDTMLGPVSVTRGGDGKMRIQIPPHLRESFEDGARIAGMQLADYVYDQVQIAREREGGGNAGLVTSEGRIYR